MLHPVDIELIRTACHSDPFSVLGPHHEEDDSLSLRVFMPGAIEVTAVDAVTGAALGGLALRHVDGFFEATVPALLSGAAPSAAYRLQVTAADGSTAIVDDPYRFPPVLSDTDVWLLGAGSHLRPFEALGAATMVFERVVGTRFCVWAPHARRVSVVGDFNQWDGRSHAMRQRQGCGVWEIFLPGVAEGALYKYEILGGDGELLPLKADPYALQCELPPATASVVAKLPPRVPGSIDRRRAHASEAPVSLYRVHPGSWRRHDDGRLLSWDELAASLLPYVKAMGFTHLELTGIQEHLADDTSAGASSALYAPTARHGSAAGFRRFLERCQAQGTGVVLDWLPTHFLPTPEGLQRFDGSCLYERLDAPPSPRIAFDLGRVEVRNFLLGNALYWLERHPIDGLRLDAVSELLGVETGLAGPAASPADEVAHRTDAAAFLARFNEVVHAERPQAMSVAGPSPALPGVARPAATGGLGFDLKLNAGWSHDSVRFMTRDPAERGGCLDDICFSLRYAFDERFVLPLGGTPDSSSATGGDGSLLRRMPGDPAQQFANLRAYLGFMFAHPGKKLLHMGSELAPPAARNAADGLDWTLLAQRSHEGVQRLCHDLNHLYTASPALFEVDADPSGFEWVTQDAERTAIAFLRLAKAGASLMLVLCNFSGEARPAYRIGVPNGGLYRQRLDTDSAHYGGAGLGTGFALASSEAMPWHDRPYSLTLTLPPLATVMIEWKSS